MEENDFVKSLEEDIEEFKKQRDKVRRIVEQVGGKPTFIKKITNVVFIILVAAAFGLSLVAKGRTEILMVEVIVLLVSAKFIYFLFLQAKVTHFQFWILSCIEWRIDDISRKIDAISGKIKDIRR